MHHQERGGLVGTFLIAIVATLSSPAVAQESDDSGFHLVLRHYEMVRLALLNDSMEGISERGRKMHDELKVLAENWATERAMVTPENADTAHALLPELSAASTRLSEAKDIKTARDHFYALSKPMVRYRSLMSGDQPAVAYCPMAKRSWLQPGTRLGNPYYGQSMPTCGELVDG